MLTAAQIATVARETEYGELYCLDCADNGEFFTRPVSSYVLSEIQSAHAGSYSDEEGHADECYCEPPLCCEGCFTELEEAYISDECKRALEVFEDERDIALD